VADAAKLVTGVSFPLELVMQLQKILKVMLKYLGQLLAFSLVASLLAGLSFLFTGGITVVALSERIFWAGMIFMMAAVALVIGISSVGAGQGIHGMWRKPEEAKTLMEKNLEVRAAMEKRYDLCILLWLAGMSCLGISALVQVVSTWV
jgi:hypothetical protein